MACLAIENLKAKLSILCKTFSFSQIGQMRVTSFFTYLVQIKEKENSLKKKKQPKSFSIRDADYFQIQGYIFFCLSFVMTPTMQSCDEFPL